MGKWREAGVDVRRHSLHWIQQGKQKIQPDTEVKPEKFELGLKNKLLLSSRRVKEREAKTFVQREKGIMH